MQILRLPDVLAHTGHKSQSSVYDLIRSGLFVKPVQIGPRSVGWPADEVQALNAARIAGMADADIRALVTRLHAKRGALALQLA